MKEPYYSFNRYLRGIFKERVHRISIDAGFDCPNLDGHLSNEGCIYCNNKAFGTYVRKNIDVSEQIKQSIQYYSKKLGVKKFIVYFQSFCNTYSDVKTLKERYDVIKDFPEIVGIFISTRPDCIDEEKIRLISSYKDNYLVWMEYGLQTTHNDLLAAINRGHTYEDFLSALALTRKYNINTGVHMILGLTACYEKIMEDAKRLASLDIQGIKFHVLHVLKETKLHKIYQEDKITLLSESEYVKIICDFLERTPQDKVVLRLVSSASQEHLIAPLWMNKKNEVILKINKEFALRNTWQGIYCND